MVQTETLWLPKAFKDERYVYFMAATHRGDMYHLRAAMQLPEKAYSVVLFVADNNPGSGTEQTQDYLRRGVDKDRHTFFVSWDRDTILGRRGRPKDFSNSRLDGKIYDGNDLRRVTLNICKEFDSTKFISDASKHEGRLPARILERMFLLEEKTKNFLADEFRELFKTTWKITPDNDNKATILVLYRDTGCSLDGVYPELDTGKRNGILTIRDIVEQIGPKGDCNLKAISCGYDGEAEAIGIGEYWMQLPKPARIKDETGEVVTRRDVDAYFLYWASQQNEQYFKMAIGLRSGLLDLFTFMGIPTVSIGLREMAGEPRHELLAGSIFKRVNAQYDTPRHPTTAYVRNKYADRKPLIDSPYWEGWAPLGLGGRSGGVEREPSREEVRRDKGMIKEMKEEDQRPFSEFDKYVLTIAVRRACNAYLKWPSPIKNIPWPRWIRVVGPFPDVVTTRIARFCYLEEEEGNLREKLEERHTFDRQANTRMMRQLMDPDTTLQLGRGQFGRFYMNLQENDWDYIWKNVPT